MQLSEFMNILKSAQSGVLTAEEKAQAAKDMAVIASLLSNKYDPAMFDSVNAGVTLSQLKECLADYAEYEMESPTRIADSAVYGFLNGYGVSIIRSQTTDGGPEGLWEALLLIAKDGKWSPYTPIVGKKNAFLEKILENSKKRSRPMSGVLSRLEPEDVKEIMAAVSGKKNAETVQQAIVSTESYPETKSDKSPLLFSILSEIEDRLEKWGPTTVRQLQKRLQFFIVPYEEKPSSFIFGVLFEYEYIIKEIFDSRERLEMFLAEDLAPRFAEIFKFDVKEFPAFDELLVDKIPCTCEVCQQQVKEPFKAVLELNEKLKQFPWFTAIGFGVHKETKVPALIVGIEEDEDIDEVRKHVPETCNGIAVSVQYISHNDVQRIEKEGALLGVLPP